MIYSNTRIIPHIIVQSDETDEGKYPISSLGIRIIKNMKANYQDIYWALAFEGTLMKKVSQREQELIDLKLTLIDEIEKKFPRPKTDKFFHVATHMNEISSIVEDIMEKYILMPLH